MRLLKIWDLAFLIHCWVSESSTDSAKQIVGVEKYLQLIEGRMNSLMDFQTGVSASL